jgi:glycosyltransferase involved in cell wall biosynthesis
MTDSPTVVYLASTFPKLSETFVYREYLALRQAGWQVRAVSLYEAKDPVGDAQVDALRSEVHVLYGGGKLSLLSTVLTALVRNPRGAWKVAGAAMLDATSGDHQNLRNRGKCLWHAVAGFVLADRIRHWQPQHLHAHMAHSPTSVAMYAAVAAGVTFSFTGHAADLFRDRQLLRSKLKRARFVVAISHWHRRFYQSIVARPPTEYPVVRCPVDTDEFRMARRLTSDGVRILTVCRLVPKKGVDQLLEALALLKNANTSFTCQIIGDGPERWVLQSRAKKLGLSSCVKFTGSQPNHVVRQAMQNAHIFVLPCRIGNDGDRDGIPVALMEAMASGVAVVSSALPTICELIDSGKSGVLLPPNSPVELSAVMHKLIADPEARESLARAGRCRVVDEFSLRTNTNRLTSILKEVTAP